MRSPLASCLIVLILTASILGAVPATADEDSPYPDVDPNRTPGSVLTGRRFDAALAKRLSVTWEGAALRSVLNRVSEQIGIAIRLDRRVDPSQFVTTTVVDQPVSDMLEQIAKSTGLETRIVGNVVVIGPAEPMSKLRTLVKLHEEAFLSVRRAAPRAKRLLLSRRPVLPWTDLTTPREILEAVAKSFGMTITNSERLPHDLWIANTYAGCSCPELLTLLLFEFDLAYRIDPRSMTITLTALPERIAITQRHTVRDGSASAALAKLKEKLPTISGTASGRSLTVSATIDEHERITAILAGQPDPATIARKPADGPEPPMPNNLTPLAQRRFTLKIDRVPALALLNKLNESGMTITYDAAALKRARVDLLTPISLDVKQVTARQFFTKICTPLGLRFDIDGTTVTLSPR